jgi:hypothetical protein
MSYYVFRLLNHSEASQEEPSVTIVQKVANLVSHLKDGSSGTNNGSMLEIPLSLCGKVMNALIWEKELWDFVQQNVSIGTFVYLRNAEIKSHPRSKFPGKKIQLMISLLFSFGPSCALLLCF